MRWSFICVLVACSTPQGSDNNHHDNGLDAATDGSSDGGGTSTIEALRFAIIGDTRPASIDDTAYYPTAIVDKIWQDIAAETPPAQFAIGTGDYMFASTYRTEQAPQLAKYMSARGAYSGPMYPAMGNHECTGATASNCGQGAANGITANMTAFMTTMLGPIGISTPYYTEHIDASDGSWTAKVVVVACNAWGTAQSSWLTAELAAPSTYTFVVRHEGVSSLSGTPCSASQTIINAHPLTLLIVGHTHTYAHYAYDKEIIVGNGGAPLTSGNNYGYVIVSRNASGTLTVTAYDYMTHAVLDTFTIGATGAAA
jgi:predicted phosphodiesterase